MNHEGTAIYNAAILWLLRSNLKRRDKEAAMGLVPSVPIRYAGLPRCSTCNSLICPACQWCHGEDCPEGTIIRRENCLPWWQAALVVWNLAWQREQQWKP